MVITLFLLTKLIIKLLVKLNFLYLATEIAYYITLNLLTFNFLFLFLFLFLLLFSFLFLLEFLPKSFSVNFKKLI